VGQVLALLAQMVLILFFLRLLQRVAANQAQQAEAAVAQMLVGRRVQAQQIKAMQAVRTITPVIVCQIWAAVGVVWLLG
jgi:hypothetical protein